MPRSPLIIAHRGASAIAPENTLAAFRLALDADGVEFDVRLARDGVPVVIHDPDLRRVGARREKIAELTSIELAQINVGSWFGDEFKGERVSTLEHVLDLLRDFDGLIYIELKCDSTNFESLASAVCDTIRDTPLKSRIIVKSFYLPAIRAVRHHLPTVETAALFEPSLAMILRRPNLIALARGHGASQISLHRSLARTTITAQARSANMSVTVWTCDNPKWIVRCQHLGIHALITNDPNRLIASGQGGTLTTPPTR